MPAQEGGEDELAGLGGVCPPCDTAHCVLRTGPGACDYVMVIICVSAPEKRSWSKQHFSPR